MRIIIVWLLLLRLCSVICQQQDSQCSCIRNCSTFSEHITDQSRQHVACSIKDNICYSKKDSITPYKPKNKTRQGWYLYPDPYDKNLEKIALNISWGPVHEGSVGYLSGYKLTLYAPGIPFIYQTVVYFCMDHKLDFHAHVKATFHYDCFGKCDDNRFRPGTTDIHVEIRSLPVPSLTLNDNYLDIPISIPSCDDPRMANVKECQRLNAYTLSGNVSCTNRSFVVDYYLPTYYGSPANLLLLRDGDEVQFISKLNNSGRFELKLPNSYNLSGNYTVELWGNRAVITEGTKKEKSNTLRRRVMFNFQKCINDDALYIPVVVIVCGVFIVLLLLGIVIAHFCLKWDVQQLTRWYQRGFRRATSGCDSEDFDAILPRRRISQELEKGKKNVKVYLIFVNDHSKHEQVVLQFVSFLRADLGFDVLFELFQSEQICADPVTWMEKSLEESDKVIVIWSPGATKRWNDYNNRETAHHDLFTPVLKNIKKDMFCDKNVGKYFFGYFEYCTKDDIPIVFRKSSIFHFKLMKQFEELYFRLKSMEMYMPGAVVREDKVAFDRYFEPGLTQYGPGLEQSICEMCAYVKENFNWHLTSDTNIEDINVALVDGGNANRKLMSNDFKIVPPIPISSLNYDAKKYHTDILDSGQSTSYDSCSTANTSELTLFHQSDNVEINDETNIQLISKTVSNTSASFDSNFIDQPSKFSNDCTFASACGSDFPCKCCSNAEHQPELCKKYCFSPSEKQQDSVENNSAAVIEDDNLYCTSLLENNLKESHSSDNQETGYWSLQSYDEKQHSDNFSIVASSFGYESDSPKEVTSLDIATTNNHDDAVFNPVVKLAPLVMDADPMYLLTSINRKNGSLL